MEHKYVHNDYNLSYILYNPWKETLDPVFCRLVQLYATQKITILATSTLTVVASMSPNGLPLLTSVSTIELTSVWVLYNPGHSPSPND